MTALQLFGYIAAATALQILLAVGIAVLYRRYRKPAILVKLTPARVKGAAWQGIRDFRVTTRVFEDRAQTQCSFLLAPIDGMPLAPHKPGQFLTFSLPVAGNDAPRRVVRCYSISDVPNSEYYRITVKRAAAPPGLLDAPTGVASTWLHDNALPGTILQVRAPSGQFILSPDAHTPPVFIAGGIGITPMFSMLKAVLAERTEEEAHLFYGVRDSQDYAFKSALKQLSEKHSKFHLHVVYASPGTEDVLGQDYDHAGFVTLDLLKQTLPHGRHAFYICGPDPMMKALIPALLKWGVDEADIHRESFGPGLAALKPQGSETPGAALAIHFRRSGRTLDWLGRDANLLDFADRNAIMIESGCRSGSCGTCETRVISGQVTNATKADHDIAPGHCLLCVGIPTTALELDA